MVGGSGGRRPWTIYCCNRSDTVSGNSPKQGYMSTVITSNILFREGQLYCGHISTGPFFKRFSTRLMPLVFTILCLL